MFTINDLSKWCNKQIKKGNGNVKIFLSNDEEGNGYHGLYYGLELMKDMEKETLKSVLEYGGFDVDINENNYKEYAILG